MATRRAIGRTFHCRDALPFDSGGITFITQIQGEWFEDDLTTLRKKVQRRTIRGCCHVDTSGAISKTSAN